MASKKIHVYNVHSDEVSIVDGICSKLNVEQCGIARDDTFEHKDKSLAVSLTLVKPVEQRLETFDFEGRQLVVMPEPIESVVITLNKEWTDNLKEQKFSNFVERGVKMVRNSGIVTLEGDIDSVLKSVSTIKHIVVHDVLNNPHEYQTVRTKSPVPKVNADISSTDLTGARTDPTDPTDGISRALSDLTVGQKSGTGMSNQQTDATTRKTEDRKDRDTTATDATDTQTSLVSGATDQRTDVQTSAKKLSYQIDEPFWEYVKFFDHRSGWGDRLRAAKSQDGSGKLELTGKPDDVASFITHCVTGRLLRGVVSKMLPIPRGYTSRTFKNFLDDLSKNKVLVRLTDNFKHCELIGKSPDVQELSRLVESKFPEAKTGEKNDDAPKSPRKTSNMASSSPATPSSPVSSTAPVIDRNEPKSAALDSFEFMTPGSQIQVSILTGDLLTQSCEVIVCPNNPDMDFSKPGLAQVIARTAGLELVDECKKYIKHFQRLEVSDVFDTRPGRIKPPVRRVIHTVGPYIKTHSDKCFELLQDTFFKCFIHADGAIKAASIAVPAISSGALGVPVDVVAHAAYRAVVAFDKQMSKEPHRHLQCIKFVNLQSDVTALMVKVFRDKLASTKPPLTTSATGESKKLDDTTENKADDRSMPIDQSQVASPAGYAALIKVAEQNGLKIFDVPKDGNCAFHAIVDQLRRHGDSKHDAASLRKEAAEFMKQNQQLFNWDTLETASDGDKDTFIANQALPGTWCNEFMLISLSEVLHHDIDIYHDNDHVTRITPRTSSGKPLSIGIIEERHYVSLYAPEATDSATRTQSKLTQSKPAAGGKDKSSSQGHKNSTSV